MSNEKQATPLYKKLNVERTQGEWMAKTYGEKFNNRIETNDANCHTIADCYHENFKGHRESIEAWQSQSNAEYISLAVNNLENLAEALQMCTKLFKAMEEQMPDLPMFSHIGYQMTRDSAKDALNRIS